MFIQNTRELEIDNLPEPLFLPEHVQELVAGDGEVFGRGFAEAFEEFDAECEVPGAGEPEFDEGYLVEGRADDEYGRPKSGIVGCDLSPESTDVSEDDWGCECVPGVADGWLCPGADFLWEMQVIVKDF
jgi:hypothetical protein